MTNPIVYWQQFKIEERQFTAKCVSSASFGSARRFFVSLGCPFGPQRNAPSPCFFFKHYPSCGCLWATLLHCLPFRIFRQRISYLFSCGLVFVFVRLSLCVSVRYPVRSITNNRWISAPSCSIVAYFGMDQITRRRISKKTKRVAASGGIRWLTMALIRRFAIWLTTVFRRSPPRRRSRLRVGWIPHRVTRYTASWILLLTTTTITIPLKGNIDSGIP